MKLQWWKSIFVTCGRFLQFTLINTSTVSVFPLFCAHEQVAQYIQLQLNYILSKHWDEKQRSLCKLTRGGCCSLNPITCKLHHLHTQVRWGVMPSIVSCFIFSLHLHRINAFHRNSNFHRAKNFQLSKTEMC